MAVESKFPATANMHAAHGLPWWQSRIHAAAPHNSSLAPAQQKAPVGAALLGFHRGSCRAARLSPQALHNAAPCWPTYRSG
jgi:hypothetical protein